jgi:hypothetical protein
LDVYLTLASDKVALRFVRPDDSAFNPSHFSLKWRDIIAELHGVYVEVSDTVGTSLTFEEAKTAGSPGDHDGVSFTQLSYLVEDAGTWTTAVVGDVETKPEDMYGPALYRELSGVLTPQVMIDSEQGVPERLISNVTRIAAPPTAIIWYDNCYSLLDSGYYEVGMILYERVNNVFVAIHRIISD